jgi:hypothetical protein
LWLWYVRPAKERAERIRRETDGPSLEDLADDDGDDLLRTLMAALPGKVIDNRSQDNGGTGDSGVRGGDE